MPNPFQGISFALLALHGKERTIAPVLWGKINRKHRADRCLRHRIISDNQVFLTGLAAVSPKFISETNPRHAETLHKSQTPFINRKQIHTVYPPML